MLSKKWHKLSEKEEESLKEEKNNEDKEDYNEIIIINMSDDSSENEKEKEDINEDKRKNLKINSIKLKSKPKAILNVDPNSIKITEYYIENNIEENYDDKLKEVINKYSHNMSNKYQDNNIIPNINEIKNKYQINKMENTLSKENNYLSKYIPGMNNISYNINYLNKSKNNKYYNYGPIYNYERKKDKISKLKEEEKEIKNSNTIEYKISNPYDNIAKENFILPINNQLSFSSRAEIRKNYPNLYYFNNILKNNILDPLYLHQYSNNNQNKRVDLSSQRSNRKGSNQYIKNLNLINENPDLKFSNKEENKYFIKRNNSINEINKMNSYNISDDKHNSYLFKKNNDYNREYSYIINDTENLFQYYQPYNNSISKFY